MPGSFSVRPWQSSDIEAASALLAARHREDRQRFPVLPAQYEDAGVMQEMLARNTSYGEGVTAIDGDGRLAGFMHSVRIMPAPNSTGARFSPPRSTMMFAHGHAADPKHEAFLVYHALYGALAEHWVADGIFDHVAHVPRGAEGPWFDLNFGRATTVAARDLRPLDGDVPHGVEIRQAGAEDVETALRLADAGTAFHAGSPILWPDTTRETSSAFRQELAKVVEDETQAVFLAHVGGEDVGLLWVGPGRGSPLFTPEKSAYIGDTAVLAESRGAGVGRALVQQALAWAREHEYQHATLHFASANALSSSFWTGVGFQPIMSHLRRHIDERILWARPS